MGGRRPAGAAVAAVADLPLRSADCSARKAQGGAPESFDGVRGETEGGSHPRPVPRPNCGPGPTELSLEPGAKARGGSAEPGMGAAPMMMVRAGVTRPRLLQAAVQAQEQ